MKALILILVFTFAAAPVCAQTAGNDRIDGKKLKWIEYRFRQMYASQLATAKKRAAFVQDALDACLAAEPYPWKESDLVDRRKDVATYQQKLAEAQERFDKHEALLAAAMADKKVRKQLIKELNSAFARGEGEIRSTYSPDHYPSYRSYPSTYSVHCRSGGYGRYFWVRCTSSSY